MLIVLYLFLGQLAALVWKDLHRPTEREARAVQPSGRLIVVDGGPTSYEGGHVFTLFGTTSIGRGTDNGIVLSDGNVSTRHAELSHRDGAWWLADLDSRNGTWVNGQRIVEEVKVQQGDAIGIGRVMLKLGK